MMAYPFWTRTLATVGLLFTITQAVSGTESRSFWALKATSLSCRAGSPTLM